MNNDERCALIDQLDRSFQMMPKWVKTACIHSMGVAEKNPFTGQPFTTFREIIETATDECIQSLRDDFEDNGDLLPQVPTQ